MTKNCKDLDEDIAEGFTEKDLKLISKVFLSQAKDIAVENIIYFFSTKDYHSGGSIPISALVNERNITLLLNGNICGSVDRIYKILSYTDLLDEVQDYASGDIIFVLKLMSIMSKAGIPKCFIGGMMLIYLELVLGLDIDV